MDFFARGLAEAGPFRAGGVVSYRSNYNPPNPINKIIQTAPATTVHKYPPEYRRLADKAPYPAYSDESYRRDLVPEAPISVYPIRPELKRLFPGQAALAGRLAESVSYVPAVESSVRNASSEDLNLELERRRRDFLKSPMPPRYARSRYGITYRQQRQLENEYYRRKRAYRYGRYRRTVRRSYGKGPTRSRMGVNVVVSPQHGIAPRMLTKCSRWVFVPTNVNGAGTGISTFAAGAFHEALQVGGNRLGDTFLDHAVGSLYGVDDYGDLYLSYRVHASKCTIHVVNISTTASAAAAESAAGSGIWFFMRYQRATPVADTTPASTDEAMNFPRMKKMYVAPPGAGQASPAAPKVMSYYVRTKKVYNQRDINEHGFQGSAGTPPVDQYDWVVYAGNHANATSATIAYRIMVKLTYWIEFFSRRDLSNSDFS